MNDIIKIVKALEDSSLLIDGATETVKHEVKKQEGKFVGAIMTLMAASLIRPMASVLNALSGKGVMGAGKEQGCAFLPLLPLSLMIKVLGKRVMRAVKGYNNMDRTDKF